jgi:HPt (histidine-containing phosphotransfer) domain-containing protein
MRFLTAVAVEASNMNPSALDDAPLYSALAADPDLAELVELFVAEVPDRITAIQDAVSHHAWSKVAILSHQLKGAAGSYGFPELSRVARSLEVAAKEAPGEAAAGKIIEALWFLCGRLRSGTP